MYELHSFVTPRRAPVNLLCRPGTNDQMMANSALTEDEYDLKSVYIAGVAVDVGAHLGMVAIGLAIDNPDARVIAVEAIPENVELMHENIALNGLSDRVTVISGAATRVKQLVRIAYDFAGSDLADMHRFIGNQPMPPGTKQKIIDAQPVTLSMLTHEPVDLLVIDCEGAEYDLFAGMTKSALDTKLRVREIRGEYHRGYNEFVELLSATHEVTQIGGDRWVGGFIARVKE
jgi:FkbM family methyltransferase